MTLEMIKNEQKELGIAIGEKRGREAGRSEQAEQTARSMLAEGFGTEQTARLTGLSPERVQALNLKL